MPRTSYHRKRPGHRAYVENLWQRIQHFAVAGAEIAPDPGLTRDLAALRSGGMSNEQIATFIGLWTELAEVTHGAPSASKTTPDFFALGAEMPAKHFSRNSRLLACHLQPKGRPRNPAREQRRPDQESVNKWMLARAEDALARCEPALKEPTAVAACMGEINASRAQARVAFTKLPYDLRRRRGQHDRWV